ncbi:MAG: AI-2E family transporter [Acidimicrobiales bacterium]
MSNDGDTSERAAPRPVAPWVDSIAQYSWRGLVIIAAAAAMIWTAAFLYLVTIPIILAVVLATFCVPSARRLENGGFPPAAAAGVVVIGGLILLTGALAAMAPSFVSQAQELRPTIEDGVDEFFEWLETGPVGLSQDEIEDMLSNVGEQTDGIGEMATNVVIAVGSVMAALVLTVVLLFFIVKDGPEIVDWISRRCPPEHRDALSAVAARTWRSLGGFMQATALVALIDAIGIAIGLAILDVPLVFPLAFLVFLGGFIPVVGALVTGMLAVFVAWAAGGFGTAVAALAVVLIVQQVESNVLQPVIMKKAVSLHPVVILAGITAGAIVAGIIGAFLAVPVTAMAAAAGNELRLRKEARLAGVPLGPTPIGGAWATADVTGAEAAVEGPPDDGDDPGD